jgi:hypothetical protein
MSHDVMMPFDLSKTVHIFKMTEQGGVQRVQPVFPNCKTALQRLAVVGIDALALMVASPISVSRCSSFNDHLQRARIGGMREGVLGIVDAVGLQAMSNQTLRVDLIPAGMALVPVRG